MGFLDGYKTYIAAFGVISTGVGQMIAGYMADDWPGIGQGWNLVLSGLVVFGIGHKMDKAKKR